MTMKKSFSFALLLVIICISPVLAVFCHNCGKGLPDESNFCPWCGKPSATSFQTAQPEVAAPQPVVATPVPTVKTIPVETFDSSLSSYEFVNQMEQLLTNSSYDVASRQARELRRQHELRMDQVAMNYKNFSIYQCKLHELHLQKFKALEAYLEAWRGTEFGPDTARAQAEKDKALFVLALVNEAIDTLLVGGGSLSSISEVEKLEDRLKRTSQNYTVTAPYLLVDNQRLNRGEPIWIIDVLSGSAKVLHMGRGRSSLPICGWVSVYDLEKRSNWRSDPVFFFSQAPATTVVYKSEPQPRVKVVIVGKKRYPYRHRHDDCDRHDRRRGPHDHRRHHHDYLIVEPRFW